MRKSEQDFPSRAEYAAALSWREVLAITWKHAYSQPVAGRDGLGLVGRCLVSMHERRRPSGKFNWTPHLVSSVLVMGALIAMILVREYGDFALAGVLLAIGIGVLFVVSFLVALVAGAVLAFRAGGWEQVLRDRDRDLAWREQLRVMLGDEGGPSGGRLARFWRRVRRAG